MYTINSHMKPVMGTLKRKLCRQGAILMVLTGTAWTVQTAAAGSRGEDDPEHCEICAPDMDAHVIRLSTAYLDSLARNWASYNAEQINRIDSLFESGFYGPPDEESSVEQARLMARLTTVNTYRDMVRLAGDPERIYEMDEATLRPLYRRYSDVNVFIGVQLEHLRLGRGRMCLRYNLEKGSEGISWHGGKRFAWQVEGADIEGRRRRVLNVHMPTGSEGKVEFLFTRHQTAVVEYRRSDGPPAPFEWFIVRDIEGAWVRKWGLHRPTAYMFWVSAPRDEPLVADISGRHTDLVLAAEGGPAAVSEPVVGLRIYIPRLRLKMRCLPDVGVEDLRAVELAMPILDLDYIRNDAPDWLPVNKYLGFEGWKGAGPLPPEIRRRFPDR